MSVLERLWQSFTGKQSLEPEGRDFDAKSIQGWPKSTFSTGIADSGIYLDQKSSLTVSTFFACLSIIGNTFAYIPKSIRKKTQNGSEIDRNHDQYRLIAQRPNPWQTSFTFWKEFSDNKKLWGNGIFWLRRDRETGRPVQYINLQPRYCQPVFSEGKLYIKYSAKLPTKESFEDPIPYEDVVHVPNFGAGYGDMGCIWGKSQVSIAKDTMGIGKASDVTIAALFKNGGFFDKYLHSTESLNKEQREIIRETLKDYLGSTKAGKMPLFDMGLDVKGLPMPLKDFAFLQTSNYTIEEIARFFTFSALHKLGHLDKMSFNNIYQMSIEFVQTTMIPESKPIEQELMEKVLRPEEKENETHYVNWEWKGLLQADPEKRKELLQMFWGMGLPANEILKIEDLNPIGPAGDISFIQSAFMPADKAEEYWQSMIDKNKNPSNGVPNRTNGVHQRIN